MADGTTWALLALAGTTALHSIPHIVHAWSKRSEAETKLLHSALNELAELRQWRKEAEGKMDRLEAEAEGERRARAAETAALSAQLERTEVEVGLWERRARKLRDELGDVYAAILSSHQGKSLPPRAPDDW